MGRTKTVYDDGIHSRAPLGSADFYHEYLDNWMPDYEAGRVMSEYDEPWGFGYYATNILKFEWNDLNVYLDVSEAQAVLRMFINYLVEELDNDTYDHKEHFYYYALEDMKLDDMREVFKEYLREHIPSEMLEQIGQQPWVLDNQIAPTYWNEFVSLSEDWSAFCAMLDAKPYDDYHVRLKQLHGFDTEQYNFLEKFCENHHRGDYDHLNKLVKGERIEIERLVAGYFEKVFDPRVKQEQAAEAERERQEQKRIEQESRPASQDEPRKPAAPEKSFVDLIPINSGIGQKVRTARDIWKKLF